MGNRERRVLLSVWACSPYQGSEAAVGWARAVETARHFETWVICGLYEADVTRWIAENGEIPTLHFCFLPPTPLEVLVIQKLGLKYSGYNLWQRRAYNQAIALHKKIDFDILHQVNLGTFREPGYLWKLDVPFVWGPIGGTENYPWRFLCKAGIRGAFSEGLRNIVNNLQFHLIPRVRKASRKANTVLTVNYDGARTFQNVYGIQPVVMQDVGTHSVTADVPSRKDRKGPLRIFCGAAFEHRKAFHLLLMALAKMPASVSYELRIAGKGPLQGKLHSLALESGVATYCQWLGWVPFSEIEAQHHWADVFVFTGLRNSSNSSVIQALSLGVPVVCLDIQGVGDMVTEKCGIKIPLTNPRETILAMRDALVSLAGDREKLGQLSQGAIERAREYLWKRKIEQTVAIYHRILTRGSPDSQSRGSLK